MQKITTTKPTTAKALATIPRVAIIRVTTTVPITTRVTTALITTRVTTTVHRAIAITTRATTLPETMGMRVTQETLPSIA